MISTRGRYAIRVMIDLAQQGKHLRKAFGLDCHIVVSFVWDRIHSARYIALYHSFSDLSRRIPQKV